METTRKPYPTDVSDDEWAFVAPYLTLMRPTRRSATTSCARCSTACAGWCAPGRRGGCCPTTSRRGRPSTSRRSAGSRRGVFEAIAHDLRALLRLAAGATAEPTAAIFDSRTLQSRRRAASGRATTGPSASGDRRCIWRSTRSATCSRCTSRPPKCRIAPRWPPSPRAVQEATGDHVEVAFVDQGYTGDAPAEDAAAHGIRLEVVKLPEAKRGFVLLPRRWVVERAYSPGRRASGAWCATTSACRRPWRACIWSPSSSSCCSAPSPRPQVT